MTIKNDGWIKKFAETGGLEPFNPDCVNPASYDIGLGRDALIYRRELKTFIATSGFDPQPIVQSKEVFTEERVDLEKRSADLNPGDRALIVTKEVINTPRNIAVTVRLKSSLARQMIVAPMGLFIDPGYEGQITFCLINMGIAPYRLELDRRVAQFVFQELNDYAEIPYGDPRRKSHYQGSRGVTGNKSTL